MLSAPQQLDLIIFHGSMDWELQLSANLFNLFIATSTVPHQWKQASIQLIPKVFPPKHHADFHPVSVTPIPTRIIECIVVWHFIYPSLLLSPPALSFFDQFAFHPTGSSTAAIILHLKQQGFWQYMIFHTSREDGPAVVPGVSRMNKYDWLVQNMTWLALAVDLGKLNDWLRLTVNMTDGGDFA